MFTMFKKFSLFAIVAVLVLSVAGFASAQDDTTPTEPDQPRFERPDRPNRPDRPEGPQIMRQVLAAINEEIEMTPREFMQALRDGQTPAEIITEAGGSVENVVTAMMAPIETRIAEAVANGNLSQDQADELLARLEATMGDILNGDIRPIMPPDRQRRSTDGAGSLGERFRNLDRELPDFDLLPATPEAEGED